jgi:hypothetical protein
METLTAKAHHAFSHGQCPLVKFLYQDPTLGSAGLWRGLLNAYTMEQHLQAIVTVLSLVNPLICGVMFAQAEAGQTRAIRIADATKAALAVLVILLVAALAGARVLKPLASRSTPFRLPAEVC